MNEPSPEELDAIRDESDYDATPAQPLAVVGDVKRRALSRSHAPDIHRLLPQAPDAELGVLSSLLLMPRAVADLCIAKGVQHTWFHVPAHAYIYSVSMGMIERGVPLDLITLTQQLRDMGELDQCGGPAFVTSIFLYVPTAANASYYLEILTEKHVLREIVRVSTEHAARAYEEQDEPYELLSSLEIAVLEINKDQQANTHTTTSSGAVIAAMESIQACYDNKGSIQGLTTGFPEIDSMLDGLHRQEVVIIAARPSNGKSALLMNIADHIAVELQKPVGIFSLEMSSTQLMQRAICSRARVNLSAVREGHMSDRDYPAINRAAAALQATTIIIDDSSDLTIQELRSRARRMKHEHAVEVIFVDYLGLLKSTSKKSSDNRQQEVAEVSGGLKAMAKELDIPVVVLCQISRKFDERGGNGGRPRLADLRESGAIEQDADTVMFLVRLDMYAEGKEREELRGQASLIVAKQRNGPVGDIALTFIAEYTKFETRSFSEPQPELGI